MAGTKTVVIDVDKFRRELRRRGLNMVKMSREMGYSDGYISNVLITGRIGAPAAKQLAMRYNISIDEIKPDEPVEIQQLATPASADPANTTGDLEKQVAELTEAVKEMKDEFRNYRTAMLGYMRKFENHKKYGHF